MHGKISTYDNKKGEGRVQADDGHIYWFNRDCIARAEDSDYLMMEVEVEFEVGSIKVKDRKSNSMVERQGALELKVLNYQDLDEHNVFYAEPSSFLYEKEDLVEGFDVLDRGLYSLSRSDRTEEKARYRLTRDCLEYGANSLVSYKVDVKLKNAFGNGYNIYTVTGVPVILGRRDEQGELRSSDLKNRLDQNKIKKAHEILVNTRIGKMVVKGLAALLLLIFALGFFLTGGLQQKLRARGMLQLT